MFKLANCVILFILFFLTACQKTKTEKTEVLFWNHALINSSYTRLYKDKDTTRALHYFDSVAQRLSAKSVYLKAARYDLKANYYYFFSSDNYATAAMIDSALAVYKNAEAQNHYPRTCEGLLLFGGQIAYRLNQFNKANDYYFMAKKLGDDHLNPCERTPFYYSIAMVLYRQENYAASLNYFEQAYALQQTCAPQTTAIILQQQEIQDNIGLCFARLKNDDSATKHFSKALEIANRYKDSLGPLAMDKIYGVIYGNQAKVLINKNRLDEAEKLSVKSIALNDCKDYEEEFAQTIKLQLAEIYQRKKDLPSMFNVLSGMQSRMAVADAAQRLRWQQLMADYFENSNRPDSALRYLKSYILLNDSVDNAQKQLTAADVTRQLKDEEQQMQIDLLKKDNQQALSFLCIALAASIMALVIIYLVYSNYRRNKKNLVVLQVLNEEIRSQKAAREEEEAQRHKLITEAVILAQENERSFIGLELHDNVNQVLTTVKLHNEMVLSGMVEPGLILPRTVNYLQQCIDEIRSLSKQLSAPTLGKISLQESITDLVNSINETSRVKINCQIKGLSDPLVKKELHLGIYRILQEQLHNVLKHAEASEVSVRLEHKNQNIRLSVSDNGKGFNFNQSQPGIGLVNMQTRAESLNGTFHLQTQPGEGCKIEVIVPCT